jgi:hypothetical protein
MEPYLMFELILTHNGKNWIARNEMLTVSAPTLEELDAKIKASIRKKDLLKKRNTIDVMMYFDNSIIPQWMRQYAQHYFNRIIQIKNEAGNL